MYQQGGNRNSLTTRMPKGFTNAAVWQTMGNSGVPDPTWSHLYSNDFDSYNATEWMLTGVSAPAAALVAGDGGLLALTTSATTAADSAYLQKAIVSFALKAGKATFFKFAGMLSDVMTDDWYAGLADAGSGIEGTLVDGIVIHKAAGSAQLALDIVVAGVHNIVPFPAACVPVANTMFEVGFAVDTVGNVTAYFNPTTGNNPIMASVVAGIPGQSRGAVAQAQAPTLPASNLAPIVGLLNTTILARTCMIDYLVVSRER